MQDTKRYLAFSTTAMRLNVNIVDDSTLSGLQGLTNFAFPPALPRVIYIEALRASGLKIRCVYPVHYSRMII